MVKVLQPQASQWHHPPAHGKSAPLADLETGHKLWSYIVDDADHGSRGGLLTSSAQAALVFRAHSDAGPQAANSHSVQYVLSHNRSEDKAVNKHCLCKRADGAARGRRQTSGRGVRSVSLFYLSRLAHPQTCFEV